MQRASAYSHPDGAMATAQKIAASLCGYEKAIIDAGIDIYKSDDMKVGIDIPSLVKLLPLLGHLVAMDPRGGIFLQKHMANAIDETLGKLPGMKGVFFGQVHPMTIRRPLQRSLTSLPANSV